MLQSFQGETRKIQNCVPIADSTELDTEQGIKRWIHTPKCASVIYSTNFDNLSRKNDKNRSSSFFHLKLLTIGGKAVLLSLDSYWSIVMANDWCTAVKWKTEGVPATSYFCVLESQSRVRQKNAAPGWFSVDIFSFSMEMTPLMKGEGLSYQEEETAPDFEKEPSWASSRSELRFRVTEYYWDRWLEKQTLNIERGFFRKHCN